MMSLKSFVLLNLAGVYLILKCFIGVDGNKYSQSEIDDAFEKMISRERFYILVDNKMGCWPQRVIPYTIKPGFSKFSLMCKVY